ncbi:MAG: hypothetical protein HQK53_10205 [Oligoflexia bacterium]|nr:hypothetical protein [Oligoflexia bacterium]
MLIDFYKYSVNGNDFVLIDNRRKFFDFFSEVAIINAREECNLSIKKICDRRMGVGADGVIFLGTEDPQTDFTMTYFNADGGMASMCGNGARATI